MVIHVGFISPWFTIPDVVLARIARFTDGASTTVTLAPPSGVQVGDTMVACVSAGTYAGSGGVFTLTPAAGWTSVHEDTGAPILTNLYTKIADAADEAQTVSYTWVFAHTGDGLSGMVVVHLSWEPKYGTTLTAGTVDHTLTPSVAAPGTRWQFSYIAQRTASAFAQSPPDPIVTSTASLLYDGYATGSASYRAGNLRVYGSRNVSPITGAYPVTPADPAQGLVVAAVSP